MSLSLTDTMPEPVTSADSTLGAYWRQKFDALTADTTAATIRSLRAQLRAIRQIATEAEPDALSRIVIHAGIGLELTK